VGTRLRGGRESQSWCRGPSSQARCASFAGGLTLQFARCERFVSAKYLIRLNLALRFACILVLRAGAIMKFCNGSFSHETTQKIEHWRALMSIAERAPQPECNSKFNCIG
jgi:hypothetical protein